MALGSGARLVDQRGETWTRGNALGFGDRFIARQHQETAFYGIAHMLDIRTVSP